MEVEVCIVSVEEPPVLIDGGLKPPLVIPVGKPDSLPTLKFTVPVKPLRGRDSNGIRSKSTGDYFLCSWPDRDGKVRTGGKNGDRPRRWAWIRVARSVDYRE